MAEPAPPPQRRLSFYGRLSKLQKREYDRSDAMRRIPIPPAPGLGRVANVVVASLATGKPAAVASASNALVAALCDALARAGRVPLGVPKVKVVRVRPRSAGGELHGLYTRFADGRSEIRVWMYTAREQRIVRPRTYLRTLLHEVVHHLDVTLLELDDSFHTDGFFRRESSLVRQLLGTPPKNVEPAKKKEQLTLF